MYCINCHFPVVFLNELIPVLIILLDDNLVVHKDTQVVSFMCCFPLSSSYLIWRPYFIPFALVLWVLLVTQRHTHTHSNWVCIRLLVWVNESKEVRECEPTAKVKATAFTLPGTWKMCHYCFIHLYSVHKVIPVQRFQGSIQIYGRVSSLRLFNISVVYWFAVV